MSFHFRKAHRQNVPMIIGIAGPSGGGKTRSAMRLATGLAGDQPFAVIDTEAGRALHYADDFNFDHGDLEPPFEPNRYLEAIQAADQAGYPVIVVDSASHEHAGDGGLLDMHEAELQRMAGNDFKKRDRVKMAAWIKPKQDHKRFMSKLLQLRAHLILCFRAEEKVEIVKNNGKTEIVPKKSASGFEGWLPVCEKTLPYELTASMLVLPNAPGVPQPIKLQEQHRPFFPDGKPITEGAGRKLGEWAKGGAAPRKQAQQADQQGASSSAEKVAQAFQRFNVTRDMIESMLGHSLESATDDQIENLREVYSNIKDGMATVEQYFGQPTGNE